MSVGGDESPVLVLLDSQASGCIGWTKQFDVTLYFQNGNK